MPQLPLTVGQSALDIKHCTVCIHLISSFSGEKVSTTLLTNSWASAICSEDRSVLRRKKPDTAHGCSLSFFSKPPSGTAATTGLFKKSIYYSQRQKRQFPGNLNWEDLFPVALAQISQNDNLTWQHMISLFARTTWLSNRYWLGLARSIEQILTEENLSCPSHHIAAIPTHTHNHHQLHSLHHNLIFGLKYDFPSITHFISLLCFCRP